MIRDIFFIKVESMQRRISDISESDKEFLIESNNDYTYILEFCIRSKPNVELVGITLHDKIDGKRNIIYRRAN